MTQASSVAQIECDEALRIKLATTLQFAITGKKVYDGDSLTDLVARHCPEIYQLAKEAGFLFVPSADKRDLEQVPPNARFDVIRIAPRA